VSTVGSTADEARAAAHLQAAGQTEAAVARYLAAVHEATAHGDVRRAYSLVEQALLLLDKLPTSTRRALLRTQLCIEKGRLQWHGALLGAPYTLQEALASLETAGSELPHEAPAEVVVQLATVTAGICYDLGDLEALQRALEILTVSSRRLMSANEPVLAAGLLNDQAAVYIRAGDPVRATYLLSQSRELFERRRRTHPEDTMAIEELAETHHLLARLFLHAQLRPGREQEAATLALEHARAAESTYQSLGQQQPLARVLETMGRLELQRGQLQAAHAHLSAAFTLQRRIGDVIGLARSTAALAELCVLTGRLEEAVALLSDSVTLNFEKGSPLGLAFNRRALDALAHATAQRQGADAEKLRGALEEMENRLAHAEGILGRLVVPGESAPRTSNPAAVA
jgi:tetratricopeptide (TPR) repeat protein